MREARRSEDSRCRGAAVVRTMVGEDFFFFFCDSEFPSFIRGYGDYILQPTDL